MKNTKSPASLDQCNVGVVDQERDGSAEKVRLRAKIGVENGYVLTVLDVASLKPFFKSAGFVACSVFPDLVRYVYAFACPSLTLHFHHLLQASRQNPQFLAISGKNKNGTNTNPFP